MDRERKVNKTLKAANRRQGYEADGIESKKYSINGKQFIY